MFSVSEERQTPGGIIIPGDVPVQNAELSTRLEALLDEEVANLVGWAKAWPKRTKEGELREPPLDKAAIMQAVNIRARAYLWPQHFAEVVYHQSCDRLGLNPPAQPLNRQQQRAAERDSRKREGRPDLKILDPSANPGAPADRGRLDERTREQYTIIEPTPKPLGGPDGRRLSDPSRATGEQKPDA